MDIFLQPGPFCKIINDFFDFNQIPFETIDLYNSTLDTYGRYDLSQLLLRNTPTLLILDCQVLDQILSWERSKNQLIKFSEGPNKIWVWEDGDSSLNSLSENYNWILNLSQLKSNSMTWFLDAPLAIDPLKIFPNNIQIKTFPHTYFLSKVPRIHGGTVKKQNCQKQFLLTMIKKPLREYRDHLWNELSARPDLSAKGYAYYKEKNAPWVGRQNLFHEWMDGHASMDLYLDAWVEVVPETAVENIFFITEKTVKPIATKTPFLTFSTPGYLKYLKNKGFQTFDSLIDESYNEQYNIKDQAKMLIDQLEFIVASGAEDFYNSCSDILDHNYQRLCELNGSWQYDMDNFIAEALHELGI